MLCCPESLREIKMATVNVSTIWKHLVFGLTKINQTYFFSKYVDNSQISVDLQGFKFPSLKVRSFLKMTIPVLTGFNLLY